MKIMNNKFKNMRFKIIASGLILLSFLGVTSVVNAQKRAINSAEFALESQAPEDLIIAQEEIEKAKVHKKTNNSGRMWLVRAKVYNSIYNTRGNELVKPMSEYAGLKSSRSILNFYKTEDDKKDYDIEESKYVVGNSFATAFNESVTVAQRMEKSDEATAALVSDTMVEYYQLMLQMYEKLDTGMINQLKGQQVERQFFVERIAYFALKNSNETKRLEILASLLETETPTAMMVESYSRELLTKGDTLGAKDVIKNALKKTNYNNEIFNVLVNYYITIDQESALMGEIDNQIAEQPNSRNYWIRGYLNERAGNYDEATKDYTKSRELDEYNYDANWNLGVCLMKYETRKILDKKSGADAATKAKLEEQKLTVFKNAKSYLLFAAENPNYTKDELVNISTAIRTCCLELSDKACAGEQRDKIRSLNGYSLMVGDTFKYRISGNSADLQISYQNNRNTNSTMYINGDEDFKKAGWIQDGYDWVKTFVYSDRSDMLSLAVTMKDDAIVKGEIIVNDEVVAEKEVETEGARFYLQF